MSLLFDIIAFLLLGLLGLETLRRLVRRLVPAVKDKYLDTLYILILGFGVYLFFPKEVAERELREKQNRTEKALLSNQDELTRTTQELSKARAELTETQKQLKKEQQARLEIEEKLAWRNLSADQQKRIFAKLNKFPGTPFQLRVFQEPEALRLMNQIADILHSAAWVQQPIVAAMEISNMYGTVGISLSAGIIVSVDPSHASELGSVGKALAIALAEERITSEFKFINLQSQRERIHVAIGKKP